MAFEYTVEDLPTEDFDGTEPYTFTLKDVGDLPVGILRKNRRNQEAIMFATFEWGLPAEQMDAFDRMNSVQLVEMMQAWQDSGKDADEPVAKTAKG